MKICLDPGHSGSFEPGATAEGRYMEAIIVLFIAKAAAVCLTDAGHEVLMTRSGDIETDDLAFRVDMANANGCGVFVSIHANSFSCAAVSGVETYFYPDSASGARLALALQNCLLALGYWKDRGIKPADFYVLKNTAMPAALVEAGFLSNPTDRAFLIDKDSQRRIGQAIAQGIVQYFDSMAGRGLMGGHAGKTATLAAYDKPR